MAEIDPATGNLTLHSAHQATHSLKWCVALTLARRPVRESIRRLVRQREQTKAIFGGIRTFLSANPTPAGLLHRLPPLRRLLARQLDRLRSLFHDDDIWAMGPVLVAARGPRPAR